MSIALINTRPIERNKSLLEQGDEYALPVLQLDACPLDEALIQQLYALNQADVVIVVSPMAVQVLMDYTEQLNLQFKPHLKWLAVGKTTAQCLARYQIQADIPSLETSEGLFQLPIFSEPIKRVAFLRGHGGREWLMQQLNQQGIQVDNLLLYRRAFPTQSYNIWQQLYPTLSHYTQVFVLISSGESWKNWLKLVQDSDLTAITIRYLVLGQRVWQMVVNSQAQHASEVILLEYLHDDAIKSAIAGTGVIDL